MALQLKDIQAPVAIEMQTFERKFRAFMKSNVFLVDQIMSFIVKRKGKQMRPLFVFLTAGVSGDISDKTYRGGSMIELLHTASLVHDDVVDDSNFRRGFFSVNALWKNKIAVLVGDYLLSRGLLLSVDYGDYDLLKIVSEAVKEMSEGELLQISKARTLDITEEIYFEVIRQKTASLIASCCAVGAASSGAKEEEVKAMKSFGLNVGMAFQIKDDLFDYGSDEIGKPRGIDIKEKKMTLPLIYALRESSKSEKRSVLKKIKRHSGDNEKVQQVIVFVKEKGGIEYATQVMNEFHQKALQELEQFPDSTYKNSLKDLVQFTIERIK